MEAAEIKSGWQKRLRRTHVRAFDMPRNLAGKAPDKHGAGIGLGGKSKLVC